MAKPSYTPTPPAAFADDLLELLYRYGDLISAQYAALQDGNVSKASMLAKSSEAVLAQAYRADRHLGAARAAQQLEASKSREINRRLRSATSHVQERVAKLSLLLSKERSHLLKEIGRFEPHGDNHGPQSDRAVAPTVLNIRT